MVAYRSPSIHFQLRKRNRVGRTQIRRVRGWLSLLPEQWAVPVVLLSMHVAQIVHTVLVFSNHETEYSEQWFSLSRTPCIILQLAQRPSFKTAATRAMFSFVFIVPDFPFHSSVFNRLFCHRKPATPSKYHSTQHGRVT